MDRRALLTTAVALTATACTSGGGSGGDGAGTGSRPGAPARTTPAPAPPPAPRTSRAPDWNALARSLDGRLIRPDDADYPAARQLYNTRFDTQRPAAVAYAAGEDDIRECLAHARAHGVPVSIRGGGHSYAGWSSGTGRLVIDVSALDRVAADGTIGAGARLADVYRTLARTGRTLPAGSCPSVGISGLTLGGGQGVTSRAYGLTCDSLLSATLVTAAGTTLTTSADEHPELFWALRGAGNGNFGVVTALRFRTSPAPAAVTGRISWPWPRAAAVLAAWQRWGPDQPDEIWSSAHLGAAPGGAAPNISVAVCSLGTEGELSTALDRLIDRAGAPAGPVSLRRRGHLDAMLGYADCATLSPEQCRLPGTVPGRSRAGALQRDTYASASDFFDRDLPADGIRALLAAVESFRDLPAGQGSVSLTALGGAVNRVDPSATAFVHRRSRTLAQYIASWRAGTPGGHQRAWLGETHRALRPHASGAAYQNYPDPRLADWRRAYYGPAADRLTRLKRRYDPERVFDFPQAL
ncbi:FAD-binding oxidoreductase [Streptomyces sp. NPDC001985]|uniref:FAD-binding oxidoreductase n=1 Tax=Streptomyces sp. NPDC001985 TaxID=3154406 RepID=UPI00331BD5B2